MQLPKLPARSKKMYQRLLAFFILFICTIITGSFTKTHEDDPMFMAVITITGIDEDTGGLILSDHGNTTAKRSEKVKWIIHPNSGVKAITGITVKEGSTNVFDPEPKQLGNSSNWQGTIDPKIDVPAEELYNIIWTDSSDTEHIFDPKIQVKS